MKGHAVSNQELISELRLRNAEIDSLRTRLQNAEDEIHASEERQRALFENSMFAIGLADGNQILYANRPLLALFGYETLNEFISIPLIDHVAQSSRATILDRLEKVATGAPVDPNFVYDIRRRDGSERKVEIIVMPSRWKGRKCRFSLFRDITERRRTEEALRESEAMLNRTQEIADVGSWELDLRTGAIIWSKQLYRQLGERPDDFLPSRKVFEQHLYHEDWTAVQKAMERALADGVPFDLDFRIVRSDGEVRILHSRGEVVCGPDGQPFRLHGASVDITERKKAEEELSRREEWLRLFIDNAPAALAMFDREMRFMNASRRWLKDVGMEDRDLRGLSHYEVFPETSERWRDAHRRGLAGEVVQAEDDILQGAGRPTRWLRWEVHPWHDATGQTAGIVVFSEDITERKRAEEDTAKLAAQLQQAQKMESVGRLAGGVAHDFNNMLGVILGNVEIALDQIDPAQPLYDGLKEIQNAGKRSADLTRQLLAFARKQNIAPKVLDLNDTIAGMLKMLKRMIGENICLNWLPSENLWPVMMDPSQLDQTLANLCVNARDAIHDTGTIAIKTRNCVLDEEFCGSHAGCVPGEYVQLTVSDDGCGMDEETLSHIFEPFFTTKGAGVGTGLGLSTVYGAIKQDNGFIYVDSAPGPGTTITIYLPRHRDKAEVRQAWLEVAGPSVYGQGTILLVEDEPALLKLVATMLQKHGYTVMAASTPGEAIRLAREHPGEIHLLMTDVIMPEINGRDLAEKLLSLYPNLKRLFMSGYTAEVIAHQGVLEEGVGFIQKPFTAQSLADKVKEVLDRPAE
jgi:two-component system cell cycle sensor histidine kinase/response regulator CckA